MNHIVGSSTHPLPFVLQAKVGLPADDVRFGHPAHYFRAVEVVVKISSVRAVAIRESIAALKSVLNMVPIVKD